MKIIYSKNFNYHLGILKYLHPFDGVKFQTIQKHLQGNAHIEFIEPTCQTSLEVIDEFLSSIMRRKIRDAVFIFRALEIPHIPLMSFEFLDRKILTPMRWGVAGTLLGARRALLENDIYWNLSGGYHHAMQQNMEGFCIYNDIGISYQQLLKEGLLKPEDKILIIDVDAHHGNGNAYTFMENPQVDILDVYNAGIYPTSGYSRDRVNFPLRLKPGTEGEVYLRGFAKTLEQIGSAYALAFVVAGTDVLLKDKLGGLCLSIEDVAQREYLCIQALRQHKIPAVLLGGGGYSKDSAKSVIAAIEKCSAIA